MSGSFTSLASEPLPWFPQAAEKGTYEMRAVGFQTFCFRIRCPPAYKAPDGGWIVAIPPLASTARRGNIRARIVINKGEYINESQR